MEKNKWIGPFSTTFNYQGQKDFDKYYLEVTEKEIFKESGEVDPETGEKLGTIEKKLLIKKIDIEEYLNSQRDSVGVESYVKALSLQGVNVDELNTSVNDKIVDFSNCPDNLADTMMLGEKAKKAFNELDPALKGNHTTLDGFLNSLSAEVIDKYISSKVEAAFGKKEIKEGE